MVTTLLKSTLREIRQSLGRYLAILAIVGLGVGFFAGLRICLLYTSSLAISPAVVATALAFWVRSSKKLILFSFRNRRTFPPVEELSPTL